MRISGALSCLVDSTRNLTRISVFGLGYVGADPAGCFAQEDHSVFGVGSYQPMKVIWLPILIKEIWLKDFCG
jgi:hypothetical protein